MKREREGEEEKEDHSRLTSPAAAAAAAPPASCILRNRPQSEASNCLFSVIVLYSVVQISGAGIT